MIDLADVERALATRTRRLRFEAPLEQQFELDNGARRAKRLRSNTLSTVVLYNLFMLGDMLLSPDQFGLSLLLHLCVVTPWMLMAASIFGRRPTFLLRESIAATLSVVMGAQVFTIFVRSVSPDVSHYQYYFVLMPAYACILQQLPHRFARFVCLILTLLHGSALLCAHGMAWEVSFSAFDVFLGCAYISLVANYYHERDLRRSYLRSLADRIRKQHADAASRSDVLTELGNRLLLTEKVGEWWSRPDAEVSPVAAIMLDVDCFKAYNDRFGHLAGDRCLHRIAACVISQLNDPEALAIRYGGEEFLVLVKRTDLGAAAALAERLRRAVESMGIPHDRSGVSGIVTASFGLASAPVSALPAIELIAAADAALYAAKRSGRNRVWPTFSRQAVEQPTPMLPLLLQHRAGGK